MTYSRDFSQRLSEHLYWLFQVIGKAKVRVGYLVEQRRSRKRLKDVESFLIFAYQPEYNEIGKWTYSGRDLRIINSGRRGPLRKEVNSSDYVEW